MTNHCRPPIAPDSIEHQQTAVRCENRQQFGAYLRSIREQAGLSRPKLSRRSSLEVSQIYAFESGARLPKANELEVYYASAYLAGIFPGDLLSNLFTLEDREHEENSLPSPAPASVSVNWAFLTNATCDNKMAMLNAKAFLQNARWLPSLAQIRIDKLAFYKPYVKKIEGLEEYCAFLAKDAMNMLAQYKETGALFDELAGDLPGYELVKRQFYFGETLDEILKTVPFTRRWAQTLQARTLSIFQERVIEIYGAARDTK